MKYNNLFPSPQGDSFFILENLTEEQQDVFNVSVPSRGFFFYSKKGVIMLDFGKAYSFRPLKGILFLFIHL